MVFLSFIHLTLHKAKLWKMTIILRTMFLIIKILHEWVPRVYIYVFIWHKTGFVSIYLRIVQWIFVFSKMLNNFQHFWEKKGLKMCISTPNNDLKNIYLCNIGLLHLNCFFTGYIPFIRTFCLKLIFDPFLSWLFWKIDQNLVKTMEDSWTFEP